MMLRDRWIYLLTERLILYVLGGQQSIRAGVIPWDYLETPLALAKA